MKIAVFGSGAIGGYIGGRLAQAGHNVHFIARGEHLDVIAAKGLKVNSIGGDFSIHPANVTDQAGEIGAVEMVLCGVKSWQVSEITHEMTKLIGPHTVVITVQNGVEAHTTLSRALGGGQILPGLCKMICMIEAPGVIRHAAVAPYLAFGETDGRITPRVLKIADLFAGAQGLTVDVSEDIIADLWKKFMLIAPWSGIGAITRAPIGIFRSQPETRKLMVKSIREIWQVAKASKVDIEESSVDGIVAFIDQIPAEGTASMQRDIMEGRPSELHEQVGAVVRLGGKGGVATPVNRFIYHSLLPLERRARGEIDF